MQFQVDTISSKFLSFKISFWTQKVIQDEKREAYIMPVTAIDQAIPYSPIWSLPYSFLCKFILLISRL